jgi:hypothetical protein
MRHVLVVLPLLAALAGCPAQVVVGNPCDDDTSLWIDATYDGVRRSECVPELGVVVEIDGMPAREPNFPDLAIHLSPDVPVTVLPAGPSLEFQNIPLTAGRTGAIAHTRGAWYTDEHFFVTVSSGDVTRDPWWLTPRSGSWRVLEPASYGEHFTLEIADLEFEPWDTHTLTIHRLQVRAYLPAEPIVLDRCGFCFDAGSYDAGAP